ncbi:hypothetical protein E2C01_017630 [Portunus trituberculatus]|uniref:Uncharacterized protein n=1 Tax=Portunus trituberculatus TaxID=210409 RepID=A0A5B7DU14_PORTR|nr:hypothetical protein [Portunus trituberculatus]
MEYTRIHETGKERPRNMTQKRSYSTVLTDTRLHGTGQHCSVPPPVHNARHYLYPSIYNHEFIQSSITTSYLTKYRCLAAASLSSGATSQPSPFLMVFYKRRTEAYGYPCLSHPMPVYLNEYSTLLTPHVNTRDNVHSKALPIQKYVTLKGTCFSK